MTIFAEKMEGVTIALLQNGTCNLLTSKQLAGVLNNFKEATALNAEGVAKLKGPTLSESEPKFTM